MPLTVTTVAVPGGTSSTFATATNSAMVASPPSPLTPDRARSSERTPPDYAQVAVPVGAWPPIGALVGRQRESGPLSGQPASDGRPDPVDASLGATGVCDACDRYCRPCGSWQVDAGQGPHGGGARSVRRGA